VSCLLHEMSPNPKVGGTLERRPQDVDSKTNKRSEILYEGRYYDVTSFIRRHPGGNVIKFYTEEGEDATQAIQQFHNRSMNKIKAMLKSFPSRPAAPEECKLQPFPY